MSTLVKKHSKSTTKSQAIEVWHSLCSNQMSILLFTLTFCIKKFSFRFIDIKRQFSATNTFYPNKEQKSDGFTYFAHKIIAIQNDTDSSISPLLSLPVSFITVQDCLSIKDVHKSPSCLIVDLGHKDIRFFVLIDHQVVDTWTLGFGGSSLSRFFVLLLKDKFHKKECSYENVSKEITLENVCRVMVSHKQLKVFTLLLQYVT